jgi:hypothetical protein
MKKIYVLKSAPWMEHRNQLTNRGRQQCLALQQKCPKFDIIISSRFLRGKRTAELITKMKPKLDGRAGWALGYHWWRKSPYKMISKMKGIYSGVSLVSSFREPNFKAGVKMIELIEETMEKLPLNGKALIISRNRCMLGAEAILKREKLVPTSRIYHPLEGFVIDENFKKFKKVKAP